MDQAAWCTRGSSAEGWRTKRARRKALPWQQLRCALEASESVETNQKRPLHHVYPCDVMVDQFLAKIGASRDSLAGCLWLRAGFSESLAVIFQMWISPRVSDWQKIEIHLHVYPCGQLEAPDCPEWLRATESCAVQRNFYAPPPNPMRALRAETNVCLTFSLFRLLQKK